MAQNRRGHILIAAFAAAVVAFYVIGPLRQTWFFATFVDGRTFNSSYEWFNPMELVYWEFSFVCGLILGITLGVVFRASTFWVAVTGGVVLGLVHFLHTRVLFRPSVGWIDRAWVYGEYFVPVLGSIAGALVLYLVRGRKKSSAT